MSLGHNCDGHRPALPRSVGQYVGPDRPLTTLGVAAALRVASIVAVTVLTVTPRLRSNPTAAFGVS